MILDFVRLVLVSRAQTSLFASPEQSGIELSRELFLRSVFASKIEFVHRNKRFVFIPMYEQAGYLVGRIGREHRVIENAPPDEKFETFERDTWVASYLFIDPTPHEDGQKVAIEERQAVAKTLPLFQSLCKHLSIVVDGPYIIEANAVSDAQTFWDFEKENRGKIVSISFDLTAPNMFGIREQIDSEMAELRDNEKAVSTIITLKNPNGLQLETDRVRQTVNYTVEGGGTIKARTRRKTFTSSRKIKNIDVIGLNDFENDTISAMIGRVISKAFSR